MAILHFSLCWCPVLSFPPYRRNSICPCFFRSRRSVHTLASHDSSGSERRRGEDLWRKELQLDEGPMLHFESLIEQDVQRLTQLKETTKKLGKLSSAGEWSPAQHSQGRGLLKNVVEKLLITDFFFIVFILAWFLAGLAEKAAFDRFSLIDAWLLLWPIVFQPALGLFMAAAIFTALSSFFSRH